MSPNLPEKRASPKFPKSVHQQVNFPWAPRLDGQRFLEHRLQAKWLDQLGGKWEGQLLCGQQLLINQLADGVQQELVAFLNARGEGTAHQQLDIGQPGTLAAISA